MATNAPPELTCPICGKAFTPYRSTQLTCSRPCRERLPKNAERNQKQQRNPDLRARKNAARRVGNRPEMRERHLRFSLARYGLTVETHAELLIAQHGKCAICGAAPDPDGIKAASRLHVDHVHGTTAVRGLLCHRCNPGIGYFLDNPELLEAAAAYLRRFE